jgi:enamine deaminase RidA (YjgF/YER057c/UK114 family)
VSLPSAVETIETHGCSIALRRMQGPAALELFLLCRPSAAAADAGAQADAMHRAIAGVLEGAGGSAGSLVRETLFLRSARTDLAVVRAARERALAHCGGWPQRFLAIEIEQPPLDSQAHLVASVHAILPLDTASPLRVDAVAARASCDCADCGQTRASRIEVGDELQLHTGVIHGAGDGAEEQARSLFRAAEALLAAADMDFRDVVRTWIRLRDIDRDYAALNRARRAFFAASGIDPAPASTGIGGGTVSDLHDLSLELYAVQGGRSSSRRPARTVMHAPTLNEAASYGSDFARGICVAEANKIALHVSGTASIDEAGRTVHSANFEAQADRMLVNVAALLQGQGATFRDVVSAITYLKDAADGDRLRRRFRDAGFDGFPNALVVAPICRPDLLCETEVLAVRPLPRAATSSSVSVPP